MKAALILTLVLAALPAAAQDGRGLFTTFCATCHGTGADGDGRMAHLLTVPPPDLTGLAERNGGTFPHFEVVQRIDGRDPLLAHGGEMPLWGDFFELEGENAPLRTGEGQPILTSRPIAEIVRWLESVQR